MAGRIAKMLLVLLVMVLAAGSALLTGGHFNHLADNTLAGLHWLAAAATGQVLGSVTGGIAYPVGLIGSDRRTPTCRALHQLNIGADF